MKKILLFSCLISLLGICGCNSFVYDNEKMYYDLIHYTYSEEDFEALQYDMGVGDIENYDDLCSKVHVECVRKTFQGYYAVFMLDNGKRAFVFMNEQREVGDVFITNGFKQRKDYDFIEIGKTTRSEISEEEGFGYFRDHLTRRVGYMLQDGLMFVTYDGYFTGEPYVIAVEFYNELEWLKLYRNIIYQEAIPYILLIDRMT